MKQLFRKEVIEQRKHRLSGVVSLVQPTAFKGLTYLLVLIVVVSLTFLSITSYTRKESVKGVLQPNKGLIKLSATESGVVSELLVSEGQKVERDQPLIRIKSEKYGVEGGSLNSSQIHQYEVQIERLKQQSIDLITKHEVEYSELNDIKESLSNQLEQLTLKNNIFQNRKLLNEKMVSKVKELAETGYISAIDLMKHRDNILALDQQTVSLNTERLLLEIQIKENKRRLTQLPIIQNKERDNLDVQIHKIESLLETVKQQSLSEIRAPSAGVVTGLLAKSGQSVNVQQSMLSILPENSAMQAIIYVPTYAIGFVEKEQQVRLRYHAFPYERFGTHKGRITQISSNVILPNETETPDFIETPSYRVVVELNSQNIRAYGRLMPLRSGMILNADIVIEQRSLLRWLFDPVFSIKGKM